MLKEDSLTTDYEIKPRYDKIEANASKGNVNVVGIVIML